MHSLVRSPRLLIALFSVGLVAGWVSLASAAPPPAATLVAPSGVVSGSTLTFTWKAAEGATFYYLQVNDATASPRFTLWYPAGMACPSDSATCSVAITTGWGAGSATWWVQTWNPDGLGPWSAGMRFAVNYLPGAWGQSLSLAADRYQLVMGGVAVLDRETGLVWERTPGAATVFWAGASISCLAAGTGNRWGWRLPTAEELMSLFGEAVALPPGHPFGVGSNPSFWTVTVNPSSPTYATFVSVPGGPSQDVKASSFRSWCVRGGGSVQSPQ